VAAGVAVPAGRTAAVRVAVMPGAVVGTTKTVSVAVAVGSAVDWGACAAWVFGGDVARVRHVSRLDWKPVMATYKPRITMSRIIRNPNAYPRFITISAALVYPP
jgi:hypothetical protein